MAPASAKSSGSKGTLDQEIVIPSALKTQLVLPGGWVVYPKLAHQR